MKLPKSINKLEQSLDTQTNLLSYYLCLSEEGSKMFREFKQNNAKIKELIEHAALDRKISHARFLNKIRGLGFVIETEFTFFQRLRIAVAFLFRKLDPDKAVTSDNQSPSDRV